MVRSGPPDLDPPDLRDQVNQPIPAAGVQDQGVESVAGQCETDSVDKVDVSDYLMENVVR